LAIGEPLQRATIVIRRCGMTTRPRYATLPQTISTPWLGAGHQFAIMAALPKQLLRMGFLEIAGADLARGDVRGDRQYRHSRAVTIEQPVDQVKVAGPQLPAQTGFHR